MNAYYPSDQRKYGMEKVAHFLSIGFGKGEEIVHLSVTSIKILTYELKNLKTNQPSESKALGETLRF